MGDIYHVTTDDVYHVTIDDDVCLCVCWVSWERFDVCSISLSFARFHYGRHRLWSRDTPCQDPIRNSIANPISRTKACCHSFLVALRSSFSFPLPASKMPVLLLERHESHTLDTARWPMSSPQRQWWRDVKEPEQELEDLIPVLSCRGKATSKVDDWIWWYLQLQTIRPLDRQGAQ